MHSHFLNGNVPTQLQFQELIDSTINQTDDGLLRLPGNPLRIQSQPSGTHTERLIAFSTSLENDPTLWEFTHTQPLHAAAGAGFGLSFNSQQGSRLFLSDSSGNVGIGTIEPLARLDVRGPAIIGEEVSTRQLVLNDVPGAKWGLATKGGDLGLQKHTAGTTWDEKVTFSNSGRVGVGTSTPRAMLELSVPDGDGIVLANSGNATDYWTIDRHAANSGDPGSLQFGWGATGSQLTISELPRVGINNTLPTAALDITNIGTDPALSLRGQSWGSTLNFGITPQGSSGSESVDFTMKHGIEPFLSIDREGRIGLRTSDPVGLLHVASTGAETGLQVGSYLQLGETSAFAHAYIAINARLASSYVDEDGPHNEFVPALASWDDDQPGTGMVMSSIAGGLGDLCFHGINWANVSDPKDMYREFTPVAALTTDGKLAVGHMAPQATVHVMSDEQILLATATPLGKPGIELERNGVEGSIYAEDGLHITSGNGNPMHLGTSGAPAAIQISNDGRVGIGTAPGVTPAYHFEVASTGNTGMSLTSSASGGENWTMFSMGAHRSGTFELQNIRGGGDTIPFAIEAGAPSGQLFLKNNGHIGLGTIAPEMNLHVRSTGGVGALLEATASDAWAELDFQSGWSGTFSRWNLAAKGYNGSFAIRRLSSDRSQAEDVLLINDLGHISTGPMMPVTGAAFTISGDSSTGILQLLPSNGQLADTDHTSLLRFGDDRDYRFMHRSSGIFARNTLALHIDGNDAFGIYTNNSEARFELSADGSTYIHGNLGVGRPALDERLLVDGRAQFTAGLPQDLWNPYTRESDEADLILNANRSQLWIASNSILPGIGSTLNFLSSEGGGDSIAQIFQVVQGGFSGSDYLHFSFTEQDPLLQDSGGGHAFSGTDIMSFHGVSGYVGIGTPTPNSSLHVAGAERHQLIIDNTSEHASDAGTGILLISGYSSFINPLDEPNRTRWAVNVEGQTGSFTIGEPDGANPDKVRFSIDEEARVRIGEFAAESEAQLAIGGADAMSSQPVLALAADENLLGSTRHQLLRFGADGDYQVLHDIGRHFGRNMLAVQVDTADSFGVYSSGMETLLEIEGGTGNTFIAGKTGIGAPVDQGTLRVDGRVAITAGKTPFQHLLEPYHAGSSGADQRAQLVLHSGYSEVVIASSIDNDEHGSTLVFAAANPLDQTDSFKFVMNQGGYGDRQQFLEFGYTSDPNPHYAVGFYPDSSQATLTMDGDQRFVGIGARNPQTYLHIKRQGPYQQIIEGDGTGPGDAGLKLRTSATGDTDYYWGLRADRVGNSFHIDRFNGEDAIFGSPFSIRDNGDVQVGDFTPGFDAQLAIGSIDRGSQKPGLAVAADELMDGTARHNLLKFGADQDYQILADTGSIFTRSMLAMHVDAADSFGVYSSGMQPLLEIEGGTGNTYVNGTLGIGAQPVEGSLRATGRVELTKGDHVYDILQTPTENGDRAQLVLTSEYSELVIASTNPNPRHGSTLTFAAYNPGQAGSDRKFVINQGGHAGRANYLDIGFVVNDANPHHAIDDAEPSARRVLSLDGISRFVGIQKHEPEHPLDINGHGSIQQRITAHGVTNNDAAIELVGLVDADSDTRNAWTLVASGDSESFAIRKVSEADHTIERAPLLIDADAQVGIGMGATTLHANLSVSHLGNTVRGVLAVAPDLDLAGNQHDSLLSIGGGSLQYKLVHKINGVHSANQLRMELPLNGSYGVGSAGTGDYPEFEIVPGRTQFNYPVGIGAAPDFGTNFRVDGRVDITRGSAPFNHLFDTIISPGDHAQVVVSGHTAELTLAARDIGDGAVLTFASYDSASPDSSHKFVLQQGTHAGEGHKLFFGSSDNDQDSRSVIDIAAANPPALTIDGETKSIGIGVSRDLDIAAPLHVRSLGNTLALFQGTDSIHNDTRIVLANNSATIGAGRWGMVSSNTNGFAIERLGGMDGFTADLYPFYINPDGQTVIGGQGTIPDSLDAQLSISGLHINSETPVLAIANDVAMLGDNNHLVQFGMEGGVYLGTRTAGYFNEKVLGFNLATQYGFSVYDQGGFDPGTDTHFEVNATDGVYMKQALVGPAHATTRTETDSTLAVNGRLSIHSNDAIFTDLESAPADGERAQLVLSSAHSEMVLASHDGGMESVSSLSFVVSDSSDFSNYQQFGIGQVKETMEGSRLYFTYKDSMNTPMTMGAFADTAFMALDGEQQRVGIGQLNPHAGLHIHEDGDAAIRITTTNDFGNKVARVELGQLPHKNADENQAQDLWTMMSSTSTGFHLALQSDTDGMTAPSSFIHVDHRGHVRLGNTTDNFINNIHDSNFGTESYGMGDSLQARVAIPHGYPPSEFEQPEITLQVGYNHGFNGDINNIIRFGAVDDGMGGPESKNFQFLYRDSPGMTMGGFFGNDVFAFNMTNNDSFAVYRDEGVSLLEVDGGTGDLFVAGNLMLTGTTMSVSDARLKENIEDLPYGLDEVLQLRPVTYNWRNKPEQEKKSLGLLAQEIDPILSEVVSGFDTEEGRKMAVHYEGLVPVLINAIKELNARIDHLENKA